MTDSKHDLTTMAGLCNEFQERVGALTSAPGQYSLAAVETAEKMATFGLMADIFKRLDALEQARNEDEKTVLVCLRCDTGTPHVRITAADDVDWRCGCCGLVSRRSA